MSDKLVKLQSVLELLNKDVPSTREVAEIISKVILAVKEARVSMEGQMEGNKRELAGVISESVKRLDKEMRSVEASLEGKLQLLKKNIKDETGVGLDKLAQEIYQELRKVKDSIPSETDLSEVFRQIEEVKNKPEKVISSEEVRDRLELLEGEERLDLKAIRGVDETLEGLRKEISTKSAGGAQGAFWRNGSKKSTGRLTVSATEPENPQIGDLWVDIS